MTNEERAAASIDEQDRKYPAFGVLYLKGDSSPQPFAQPGDLPEGG